MKLPIHAARHSLLALAGACAYVMFIVLVLGRDMSPVHPQWEWQLSFEHGELNAEHYAHLLGIILAALPIACFALVVPGSANAPRMLLWIGLVAAVPYLATPQLPYAEEQTWLLRHSVELEALKIAVAPWLLFRILRPVASGFPQFGKSWYRDRVASFGPPAPPPGLNRRPAPMASGFASIGVIMSHAFKVGDHVRWNSEAGHVSGTIIKVHTRDTDYKGHTRHCSEADPQYEIKSDKTDHVAMHKGAALHKID